MTPLGVDTIAIPKPLFIFGKLSALENILLPGFETLSKVLITGFPEWYLSSKDNKDLLFSFSSDEDYSKALKIFTQDNVTPLGTSLFDLRPNALRNLVELS